MLQHKIDAPQKKSCQQPENSTFAYNDFPYAAIMASKLVNVVLTADTLGRKLHALWYP